MSIRSTQVGSIVLAVLLLCAAGGLVAWTTKATTRSFQDTTVSVGEPGHLHQAEIKVPAVAAAGSVDDGISTQQCGRDCVFLVLPVEVATHTQEPLPLRSELHYAGLTVIPDQRVATAVGQRVTSAVVFAVRPTDLAGARLMLSPLETVHGYQRRLVIDLGITPGGAADLAAQSGEQLILPPIASEPL